MILSRFSIAFAGFLLLQALSSPVVNAQGNTQARGTQQNPADQKKRHFLKPGEFGYSRPLKKLPTDFPAPIYPGSVYVSAAEVDGTGRTCFARFKVNARATDVEEWYQNALSGSGWKLESKPSKDQHGIGALRLIASKEHTGCAIRITQEPNFSSKLTDKNKKNPDTVDIGISVNQK